jgi:acetyltransferase-like isoleucine patch superfamily enzyme
MSEYISIAPDVKLGPGVKLSCFINLYGCEIGPNSKIGAFVEIQKNAVVGANCKISSHTFICEGVRLEDNVFIGHNVTFVNDAYPRATNATGQLQTERDWKVEQTWVKRGASIGSGATILSSVIIGENAMIGAGSVVTRDVPANAVSAGNPARVLRYMRESPPIGMEA